MTDWLRELLILIVGGLFSATVVTSVLFYRQTRRIKEAEARKTSAEAEKMSAEADDVAYSALSKAVEQLQSENERLAKRIDLLEQTITRLQEQVREVVAENAALKRQIGQMAARNEILRARLAHIRTVILDLKQGFTLLVRQIVDAGLEPNYVIPEEVWDLLDLDDKLADNEDDNDSP